MDLQTLGWIKTLATANEWARQAERGRQSALNDAERPDAERPRPVLAAAAAVAVGAVLLLWAVAIVALSLGFGAFV
jgi:hypothetical protein